eukprot:1098407_1
MAKEHGTVTELLLESLESDDKKFKKIMRNCRKKSSQSWRKHCGPYGAMLRNQRPTLDSKLTGDCQHILIKYFHPTLGFTKIHKGFCDVIKINPSLIDFHLFIRGYAPHIVSTVHWNSSSQQIISNLLFNG